MKPTLEGYRHPISVYGERYRLLDGSIDHVTRLQHVEDPNRLIVLTSKELIAGLTNGTIFFPRIGRRTKRQR